MILCQCTNSWEHFTCETGWQIYKCANNLGRISKEALKIEHVPPTERYLVGASRALLQVLKHGRAIGSLELGETFSGHQSFEVVVWVDPLNSCSSIYEK